MSKKLNPHSSEKFPWEADNLTTARKNINRKINNSNFCNFIENVTVNQKENLKLPCLNNQQEWPNRKNFSSSKNFSYGNLTPSSSGMNTLMKNRISWVNNFNQLPVIEEEDGYCSENDLELKNYFFSNSELKETYLNRKTFNILMKNKFGKKLTKKEISDNSMENDSKPSTKLPSLLNINCLMNADIKQTQQIWNTNFGKLLINGKSNKEKQNSLKIDEVNVPNKNFENEWSTKADEFLFPNENNTSDNNLKIGGGDTEDDKSAGSYKKTVIKNCKKGPSKTKRKTQNLKKQRTITKKLNNSNKDYEIVDSQREITNEKEISNEEKIDFLGKNEAQDFQLSLQNKPDPSLSLSTRNQCYLTKRVRNILENSYEELTCQRCSEPFSNINELLHHKKKHEEEKKSCLICNKFFYKAEDFTEHLFTHESVDKYSCKKCRKYFPTLKKYKQHNRRFHFINSKISTIYPEVNERENIINYLNKFQSNYECTRCKMNFDSEDNRRAHKRLHLKMDLNAANLLCPENTSLL